MNHLRPINNVIGIVKVGDEYGKKHVEDEFLDAIRKENNIETTLCKQKLKK